MTSRLFFSRSWRQCLLLVLVGICGALAAPRARACTPSETGGGVIASVTSQRIYGGPAVTGSGTFSFNCSPTVLSALGTPTLTATMQPNVTGLTLKNANGSSIGYQIYSTAGTGSPYTGGAIVITLNGVTLLSVLNGSGSSNTVPINIVTTVGANVPAGTYTDTIAVTWTYQNICEGVLGVAGICVGVPNNGSVTRNMTVSVTVTNDCTITAPAVNFGSAPLVIGFGTVSQSISLLCSKGMVYTVGMSAGGYASGGHRRMASGASNRLDYDIFKADSTVWGSVGTARANGPAAADGLSAQNIPYTAQIYQNQTTPPVGTYSDNVVVDVSF